MNSFDEEIFKRIALETDLFILGKFLDNCSAPLTEETVSEGFNFIAKKLIKWHTEDKKC